MASPVGAKQPTSDTPNKTDGYFRIFDLSLELRLEIYMKVFKPDPHCPFASIFGWPSFDDDGVQQPAPAAFTYPALLHTCQQFRGEATKMYSSNIIFEMRLPDFVDCRTIRWFQSLDQENAVPHIRWIDVYLGSVRSLRGKLYCLERFLAWIDDSIPYHQVEPRMFQTRIPFDWRGAPEAVGTIGDMNRLREMFEEPLAQELDGGMGVDLEAGTEVMEASFRLDRWTNA